MTAAEFDQLCRELEPPPGADPWAAAYAEQPKVTVGINGTYDRVDSRSFPYPLRFAAAGDPTIRGRMLLRIRRLKIRLRQAHVQKNT